ncbi:hypothetical protein Tco_0647252, partial [Tanacetum coccineum]
FQLCFSEIGFSLGSTNEVSTASGDFGVSTAGGINQVPSTRPMCS